MKLRPVWKEGETPRHTVIALVIRGPSIHVHVLGIGVLIGFLKRREVVV
jgi:hypothetical protein